MENELVKHDPQVITEKELVSYLDAMGLAQKLNEKEKISFLQIAKAFNLNPFKREIYVVKYNEGDPLTIITGYESYIKRAERSGQVAGWGVITEGNVKDESLKAILTIHRKDRSHPFVHEVYYSEYVQCKNNWKDGKLVGKEPNKFWKEKPITMIKKVAMAQGFRLCFSDELGGMPYTSEEMPEIIDTTATVINEGSSSVAVAAVPITPTPQPIIDNHVHAVNAINKHSETLEELIKTWNRINLETQSHPAVMDEYTQAVVKFANAAENKATLTLVWNSLPMDVRANANIIELFKVKGESFKTKK